MRSSSASVSSLILRVALHAGGGADRLRARAADAVDRRQRDVRVLVIGNVDACNSACAIGNLKL